jgi:acetylornithine/succinyldiaminopimelate/putrescine aminotransferase
VTSKKPTKLRAAVHALAQISFLDAQPDATLSDAVKLAEEALRAIERDELLVVMDTTHGVSIRVHSAAGNKAVAREFAPLVTDLINSVIEAEGHTLPTWSMVE